MSRKTLIIVVTIAAIVIASVAGYALTRPTSDANTSAPSSNNSSSQNQPGGNSSQQATSSTERYVDYSPTAIADAAGTTLLFFHAPWCPSCRQIESEILSDGVPDGVTIIKVDYDSHQDLRQKYGVTVQTTFVKVDASGNELEKFVPYGGDLGLKLVLDALT